MVSPVLFKLLWAAGLFLLAIVLGVAGRYYFTNAELLCPSGSRKAPPRRHRIHAAAPALDRLFRAGVLDDIPTDKFAFPAGVAKGELVVLMRPAELAAMSAVLVARAGI